MPLALTDAQLDMVMTAAEPLQPVDRSAFLAAVANYLSNERELGDGSVFRAIKELQREFRQPPTMSEGVARHNAKVGAPIA